jgi:hypothetical protein
MCERFDKNEKSFLFSIPGKKRNFTGVYLLLCVWEAISADGWRSIFWVDGAIDSYKYCEILSENLLIRDDMDNMVL